MHTAPPEPKRIRVPLQFAFAWTCTAEWDGKACGFMCGLAADHPDAPAVLDAIMSGRGAEKKCPRCGAINEFFLKPSEGEGPRLSVVQGGRVHDPQAAVDGAAARRKRLGGALATRHVLGGLVGPDGRPLK